MKKKLIAKLLVLAMVLSIVPVAFAATTGNTTPANNDPYYTVKLDTAVKPTGDGSTTAPSNATLNTDGKAEVAAEPDSNGKAAVTVSEKFVESLAEQSTGDAMVIVIKAPGATKVETAMPGAALAAAAEKTGAALTVETPVATITIPNEALTAQFKDVGTVKISVQATGSNVGFSIAASGRALQAIKGLKVEF